LIKVEGDLLEQGFLIAFDGEVVVGVTLFDQIGRQIALGQQGIGGNGFTVNVDGRQQRDGGFDLIGLFFLIAIGYGQRTDFFWV